MIKTKLISTTVDKAEIARALQEAPDAAERTRLATELAALYGVTKGTVWAWANEAGYRARKLRVDRGRSAVTDHELKLIAARLLVGKQLSGKFTNSVKNAVEELAREGITFDVGYERLCALLRERGYDRESIALPPPHVCLRTDHPNELWLFDVTNCLQWHLDKKTGLEERNFELEFYSNKLIKNAKKVKRELLRYVIVDHCTGAFFFWYYYSPGERAADGANFFFKAFAPKGPLLESYLGQKDRLWQMHGVPFRLMSDKGSILRHKAVIAMMEGLGVEVILHQAGNPRAKGKVERLMRTIGTKFETILKYRRPKDLGELNSWALSWCADHNEQFVSRGKKLSPAAYWLRIEKEQLRLCPDEALFKSLIRQGAVSRLVDGAGHISFKNRIYFVPDTDACHRHVLVLPNAYEFPAVDVHHNGYVWLCQPLETDRWDRPVSPADVKVGTYRRRETAAPQKLTNELEEIAQQAWGVSFKGNAQKRRSEAPAPGEARIDPLAAAGGPADDKVISLQRPGTPLSPPDAHAPVTESRHIFAPRMDGDRKMGTQAFIKELRHACGQLSPEQNAEIRRRWPDGISHTAAWEIINNPEGLFDRLNKEDQNYG